jgi:hypothetical protein
LQLGLCRNGTRMYFLINWTPHGMKDPDRISQQTNSFNLTNIQVVNLYLLNENMFVFQYSCVSLYPIYPCHVFFSKLLNTLSKRVCIIASNV